MYKIRASDFFMAGASSGSLFKGDWVGVSGVQGIGPLPRAKS